MSHGAYVNNSRGYKAHEVDDRCWRYDENPTGGTYNILARNTMRRVMIFESIAGGFVPELWRPTFPKLTAELVARAHAAIRAVLGGLLPSVIANIICEFVIQ